MSEPDSPAQRIAFDNVVVDLAGHRLLVDGAAVPLEPKAFAVLVLLAREPGRVFPRDEILDAVWGHRHVTPGVLHRTITLLRHALGERGDESHYVRTVHGVGYRFDATLRSASAPATDSPMAPARTSAELDRSGDTAADATPARRRRVMRRWFAVALLVPVLVAIAVVAGTLLRREPPAGPPTLIVLPLRALGDAQDDRALAAGISEELITRLAHVEGLRLIGSTTAERAAQEHLDAAQLAQRIGVTHVLEGSLQHSSQALRIDLRLIEAPSARTLWAQDYDREPGDVLALEREIARAVAATLRLRMGLDRTPAAGDAALFREYLELRSSFRFGDRQQACEQALPALRTFAANHPDYAPAQGLLAVVHARNLCPDPSTRHAEDVRDAERAARHALELDPNSIDAHAALGVMACSRFDWQTCLDEVRAALAIAPTDAVMRSTYTVVLAVLGYEEQALHEAESSWYSDPLNFGTNFMRARLLDTLGRHDEARHYFDSILKLDADAAQKLCYARTLNALWRHDLDAARSAAAQIPEGSGFRESYQAAIEAVADPSRWPQAETAMAASEAATGHYNFLRLFAPNVDAAAAMAEFEGFIREANTTYPLLLWQPEYAALRRDPAFQDYLRRTHIPDYWRAHGFPPQCKPAGDGAVCE